MDQFGSLLRQMRESAGLSQRALAQRAGTSQPAVARYEGNTATPSWETFQRLAASCGRRLRIDVETVPDAEDVALAERLLERTPLERLRSLSRYAHLQALARKNYE